MPDNGTTIAVPDDPTPQEESGLSRNQVILIVICAVVGVVLIAVALVTFCLCKKKKKQRKFEDECESEKHDKLFHDEEMMKKYNDDKKEKIYTGLKTLGVQYSIDTQTSAPNAAVTHHQSSTFLELNEEREGDLLMAPLAAEESVSESLLNDSRESLKKPLNIVIPRDGSVKKKSVRPQSDYQTTETAKYVPKLPPKKKKGNLYKSAGNVTTDSIDGDVSEMCLFADVDCEFPTQPPPSMPPKRPRPNLPPKQKINKSKEDLLRIESQLRASASELRILEEDYDELPEENPANNNISANEYGDYDDPIHHGAHTKANHEFEDYDEP